MKAWTDYPFEWLGDESMASRRVRHQRGDGKLDFERIKVNTKLQDGKIPKNTECPFVRQCAAPKAGDCAHRGLNHNVAFSCGIARMWDLTSRNTKKPN